MHYFYRQNSFPVKILILIILTALLVLALFPSDFYIFEREADHFTPDQFVKKLIDKVNKKNYPIRPLNMAEVFNRDSSLKAVSNLKPNPWLVREFTQQLIAIEKCSHLFPEYRGEERKVNEKLRKEYQVVCHNKAMSEDWLFSNPQIHPMGGTWLFRFKDQWPPGHNHTKKINTHLHFGELESFNGWSLDALQSIINGESIFFMGKKIFVQVSTLKNEIHLLEVPIQEFHKITEDWPLNFKSESSEACLVSFSTGCFVENRSLLEKYRLEMLAFCLASFILFLMLFSFQSYREKRRAEELLKISAMAVNHEIRHPVAVLKLILDRWRSNWDKMDESFQDDLIKVFREVGRLQQLTESADFFLRDQVKREIQWKVEEIPSIRDWGQAIANDYGVDFRIEGVDGTFKSDPFWVSVAVENLIKNAKKYAKPPIVLILSKESNQLFVKVVDSGPLSPETKSASGLGFGHGGSRG